MACFKSVLLALLLGSLAWTSARATSVCVSTTLALTQAINSFDSQSDGSTLTVKVVQGTYAVGNALGQSTHFTYPYSVGFQLLGGYTANCASRHVDPFNTVIDGLNQAGGGLSLVLEADANALVEGVTFTRMTASAGGSILQFRLDLTSSDVATYEVRFCRFVHNSGHYLIDLEGAQVDFVNNLVADNTLTGSGATAVYGQYSYHADGLVVATNNTIANNAGGSGLTVDTNSQTSGRFTEISDNILWGNAASDLQLDLFDAGNNTLLVDYNDVGAVTGYLPDATNIASDPQFVNPASGSYGLVVNSPSINSGASLQVFGFPTHDLGGGSRVVGSRIDRGAFESSFNDFVSAVVTTAADNGNNITPTSGSLRAAIKAANAAAGPFQIRFSIAGGCPQTLTLVAPMLDISGDVTIDGTTQAGWVANSSYGKFDATLCLFVNGAGNSSTPWALHVPSSAASSARLVVDGLIFAGFNDAAIKLEGGHNHRIAGNQFGAVGFTLPNHQAIRVTGNSGGAFIGGYDDTSAVNLLAGSTDAGLYLDNASGGSTLANAVIGFQVDGSGNGGNATGVYLFNSPYNVLQYNFIGNSASSGVSIAGSGAVGNLLQYNTIGMDYTGVAAANAGAGVAVSFGASGTTIGSPLSGTYGANLIAYNTGPGVWITPTGGAGNRMLAGRFLNNGGLDIDLGKSGPTPNHAGSLVGPNNLQNYPVLQSAGRSLGAGGADTITGQLLSAPNSSYRLDFYFDTSCAAGASGRGNARSMIGRASVPTDAAGTANFSVSVPSIGASYGFGFISATATDASGNTSEIGNCIAEIASDTIFRNGFD